MFKKVLLSFIMITFTFTIMTGCQSKKAPQIATTITERDPYQEKQLTPETLNFYFPGYEPDGVRNVLDKIEKQLEPTLNVKLNFKWIPKNDYTKQIKEQTDGNKAVDAFVLSKDIYNDEIESMAREGYIQDITNLFDRMASLNGMYTKEQLMNVTYDGKLMAVPQNYPRSKRLCAVIENMRNVYPDESYKSMMSFNDFEKFLSGGREGANQLSTLFDLNTIDTFAEIYGYVHLGNYLVYKWDDPDMRLIPWEQTPEFKKAIETLSRWKSSGFLCNFGSKQMSSNSLSSIEFMAQYTGFESMLTTWDTAQYFVHNLSEPGFNYTILPLYEDKYTKVPEDTTAAVIGKNCKDPERVLKFLNWVQQDQEHYDLFMYGIKDLDYSIKDGRLFILQKKSKYNDWDGSDAFLNIKYFREENFDIDGYKEELVASANKNAKYPPSFGFRTDTSRIQGLIDSRKEYFEDIQKKLHDDLVNIQVDDFVNEVISQQRKAGVDAIVVEIQKQLDEWKASKN